MFLERIDPERSGRFAFLAYDQGLEHGPEDFRPNPPSRSPKFILELARQGYNAVVFQQGTALVTRELYRDVPRVIKLNGKANLYKGDPYSPLLCPVDYAVRQLDARAVGYTLYPGSEHDTQMMKEFAEVVRDARDHGAPVIACVYPRGTAITHDTAPEVVAYAARIAFELGADIAKVKWTGDLESFRWVCQAAAETKVVLSGGVKTEDPAAFLAVVTSVIQAGGAGVAVGRNVWQRPKEQAETISKEILRIVGSRSATG